MKTYIKLLARKIKTISYVTKEGNIIQGTIIKIYSHYLTDISKIDSQENLTINLSSQFLSTTKQNVNKSVIEYFEKRFLYPLKTTLTSKINKNIFEKLINLGVLNEKYMVLPYIRVKNIPIENLDIQSKTKGLGFTGTIKRFNFKQGPKSHGSKSLRRPGSIGAGTTPGEVLKNKKMAGHLGFNKKTIKNVNILERDGYKLILKNSIPGKNNTDIILKIKI